MSSQKHIQDELRSLGIGLPVNNNQPFSVPEGYFDGLAARILAKVKSMEGSAQSELEEISPLLAGISKQTPFSVPSSYFEENLTGIGAVSGELEESQVLATIGKEMPYAVPGGYFEAFPEQALKTVKPETRVVPLFSRTWMRVASAAAVAGALFFGGYQLLSSNDGDNSFATNLPAIDTVQQQVASNSQPIRKEIKQVSTSELQAFVETMQTNAAKSSATKSKIESGKGMKVEELLKDVSTSEMESFLSDIPTVDDDLIITD